VAPGVGLIEQDTAGPDDGDQVGQDRSVEVVRDHYGGELPALEGERRAVLQVALDDLDAGCTPEIAQPVRVPVHRRHRVSPAEKESGMAPRARGDVEDRPAARYQRGEPGDPR
jgi:hypothetical protein